MPHTPDNAPSTAVAFLNARNRVTKIIKFLALAGAALSVCATASAAQLTGTLGQLVARWETNDPNLSGLLSFHLASRTGDPIVVVRLADNARASQVLTGLTAAGFKLTAASQLDAR